MKLALHGQTTKYSNLASDIRVACDSGFGALEIITEKLLRYIKSGYTAADLLKLFKKYSIEPACIDILGDVELSDRESRNRLFRRTHELCSLAREIGCPTIQLNAFNALENRPIREIIRLTAKNIKTIADIGQEYGIRFQYEGAAWTPIHSLKQCMDLVDQTARDNFGLVIDFWHFWASYETEPEDIAKLDKSIIYGVHVSDGKRPLKNDPWPDETYLRGYLPGDGDIPLKDWISAVKATGFDGVWSGEILGHKLWELDHLEIKSLLF